MEFPPGAPRLRVVIEAGRSAQEQEIAKLYWEIAEDGTWARTVGSIGELQWAAATATSASYAVLLRSLCVKCDEPIRVANRSWAVKVAGKFLDRPNDKYLCQECGAVREEERERERQHRLEAARAEKERERLKAEEEAAEIAEILAAEEAKDGAGARIPYDSPLAPALYLALVGHAAYRPGKPLPSMVDLGLLGWTADIDRDRDAILDLYAADLLAVAAETPRKAFVFSEGDDSPRFFLTEARWRLVGDSKVITAHARTVKSHYMTAPGQAAHEARQALAELVEHMEIVNLILYLDGLLTKTYQYPEVPEGRRRQLADIVKKGFDAGFTPGQMICFAWRAADTAAGWKERKAMGPAEASSAAVTILNGKIDTAIEARHAIPEYEPPRWHQQPLALDALRELNADVKRVRDRAVMDACLQCDHHGLRETDTGAVVRCVHAPPATPEQHTESQNEPAGA
ncbi:hypothetical protein H7K43_12455 [Streptomyces sp. TYQ1024]|nr:hypothetical protein [Streptomyces sp. TYQ1024]